MYITEERICMVGKLEEAWGRATLRSSGALDLLVERLAASTELEEQLLIVSSMRHYIHDRTGLAHLCRNNAFMDTVRL